jgi:hypothetical protein
MVPVPYIWHDSIGLVYLRMGPDQERYELPVRFDAPHESIEIKVVGIAELVAALWLGRNE